MDNLDIGAIITTRKAIAPAARAAGATNGGGIDRATPGGVIYNSAALHTSTGAATGTPTSLTVTTKIQHSSDDGSTDAYADFAPDGVTTASHVVSAAASEGELNGINLRGAKRYVRAVSTVAFVDGTSPTVLTSSVLTLSTANRNPV